MLSAMRCALFSGARLLLLVLACLTALVQSGLSADTNDDETLHSSSPAVKTELTAVIDAQLAAFRKGDFRKAYTFAAREIQEMFGVADFELMVKSGYPVIASSARAEYGLTLDAGDEAVVTVSVQSGSQSISYQYHLKKQDGAWKIAGVSEVKREGLVV